MLPQLLTAGTEWNAADFKKRLDQAHGVCRWVRWVQAGATPILVAWKLLETWKWWKNMDKAWENLEKHHRTSILGMCVYLFWGYNSYNAFIRTEHCLKPLLVDD